MPAGASSMIVFGQPSRISALTFSGNGLNTSIGVVGSNALAFTGAYTLANSLTPKLDEAREVTNKATNELLSTAANALPLEMARPIPARAISSGRALPLWSPEVRQILPS